MSRPLWLVEIVKKIYPARDLFARSARTPVLGKMIEATFFEGDALWYLPPNRSIEIQEQLNPGASYVLPSSVIEYFIHTASVHWVMNRCICRDANGCQEYPIDLGCLFMGPAAAKINPRLGRPVSKEEARRHLQACRQAGLIHLIGRNKLDTHWLGVGPGTQLLTVCNCCPCCCLWRMLPHLPASIRDKLRPMPGIAIEINESCTGCEVCTQGVCFANAIEMEDGRAVVNENCVGCGRCIETCPVGAIELRLANHHYTQEMIESISALVQLG